MPVGSPALSTLHSPLSTLAGRVSLTVAGSGEVILIAQPLSHFTGSMSYFLLFKWEFWGGGGGGGGGRERERETQRERERRGEREEKKPKQTFLIVALQFKRTSSAALKSIA